MNRIACFWTCCMMIALTASSAFAGKPAGWRYDFTRLTDDWKVRTRPGTPSATFQIVKPDDAPEGVLEAAADKASASLLFDLKGVDLNKTPIMRWKWRAITLPAGADGRDSRKDDQAIGLYISTGGMLRQRSLAYRWETLTPKGEEGDATYGAGTVRVRWYALRNEEDLAEGIWYTEERNVAEDFEKAYGSIPRDIGVGISCNSQYTASQARAQIAWIEFVAAPQAD
jgi:hypothetical protein